MSRDLTDEQEANVRTAILHLRLRFGQWETVAQALRCRYDTIEKVANKRGRGVSARMAFRVAGVLGVGIDDLLAGRVLPHACPNCGYVADGAEEVGGKIVSLDQWKLAPEPPSR